MIFFPETCDFSIFFHGIKNDKIYDLKGDHLHFRVHDTLLSNVGVGRSVIRDSGSKFSPTMYYQFGEYMVR